MSIFLAIQEYIGITTIFYGSIGVAQGLIDYAKDESFDIKIPVILILIGIALVHFI